MASPLERFLALVQSERPARVLEAGTRQWEDGKPTHHMDWFPHIVRADYVMVDIEEGADVDVVADLHALPEDWTGRFDAFVARSIWEHLQRPWIAAREVARVLKPHGIAYIESVHTFPLHGYPGDYWRFSKEALSLIFTDAGLDVEGADYFDRCKIVPPWLDPKELEGWNQQFPSYTTVHIVGRKPLPPAKSAARRIADIAARALRRWS